MKKCQTNDARKENEYGRHRVHEETGRAICQRRDPVFGGP